MKRLLVRKDSYYDSVFLMLISKDVRQVEGVIRAEVAMGTVMNRELLAEMDLSSPELNDAGANDLIIALEVRDEAAGIAAEEKVHELLRKKTQTTADTYRHSSTTAAFDADEDTNLVLFSIPGQFAPREVRRALLAGKHVMIFSDNVSLEAEIELKALARERGLLLMGPDCGTAIINGKPLCFANVVNSGSIGVISASGTGLQEVTCAIHNSGGGVSQAIGTGGRDLKSEAVGGSTTLMAIEALAQDEATDVIVVISKPPAPAVAEKVIAALEQAGKPAVVHLIGMEKRQATGTIQYPGSLEETAKVAVAVSTGTTLARKIFDASDDEIEKIVDRETASVSSNQKYLRGYYTGGTLTDEAVFLLNEDLGGIYSFDPADPAFRLTDPHVSQKHTIVDLGEDVFTVGRPHPMIDPSTRTDRMEQEAGDEEIAVILLDCVIGYGSHPDPAGAVAPAIRKMRSAAEHRGGYVVVIASVTGTERDFQNKSTQVKTLRDAGAIVMPSNFQAAALARRVMARLQAR